MPMAISVNMFGLRFTIDAQPRTNSGQPAQSTTGVESTRPIQFVSLGSTRPPSPMPNTMSPMASATTGSDNKAPIRNRRDMSASSGFGRVVQRHGPGLERHPADGAASGAVAHDLRMHRARIFNSLRIEVLKAPDGAAEGAEVLKVPGA